MRKLILFLVVLSSSASVFGQGQLIFANSSGTRISTNTFYGYTSGLLSSPPGSFCFGLFIAPTSVTSISGPADANWIFTGIEATNSTAGRLTLGYTATITTPATVEGQVYNFVVIGWSANLGTDWTGPTGVQAQYLNALTTGFPLSTTDGLMAFLGTSSVAQGVQLGGLDVPVSTLFGPSPGGIPGFTLQGEYLVPEPFSIALLGLGGAMLAIHRRFRHDNGGRTSE